MEEMSKPIVVNAKKQEMTWYLESGFPIAIYETAFEQKSYNSVPWHWHEDFQLCLVIRGSISFLADDTVHRANAGEGVFINSRVPHSAKLADGVQGEYFCLEFHSSFFSKETRSYYYQSYIQPVIDSEHIRSRQLSPSRKSEGEILNSIALIRDAYRSKVFGFELSIAREMNEIWRRLLRLYPFRVSREDRVIESPRLRRIITYISKEYMNEISLDDIASAAGISRSECSRYFREQTGKPLFGYLNSYRISQSEQLLCESDLSIAEIAARTGFSDQSYFAACFKKQDGMTPIEYRKKNRHT